MLACWEAEEADSESSNEEEDRGISTAPSGADGPMEGDLALNSTTNANKYVYSSTITTSPTKIPLLLLLTVFVLQYPKQSSRTYHPH